MNCPKCGHEMYITANCLECGTPNACMDEKLRTMVREFSYSASFVIGGQASMISFDIDSDICVLCDEVHHLQTFPLHLLAENRHDTDAYETDPNVSLMMMRVETSETGCCVDFDNSVSCDGGVMVCRDDIVFTLSDKSEVCFSLLMQPIFVTSDNDLGYCAAVKKLNEFLDKVTNELSNIRNEYSRQLEYSNKKA